MAHRARVVDCSVANLSVSRNIGIRAAGGDIVAFIDDDALPEFDWLPQAMPAFDDPEVGGVGGDRVRPHRCRPAVPVQRGEPAR